MKTFFKKLKRQNKAFTLVETLVAIAIFTISITALMSVLGSGISNTTYAKTKMTATYLAQEGIEYIRNARDSLILKDGSGAWNGFTTSLINICDDNSGCGFNFTDITNYPVYECDDTDNSNDCKLKIDQTNGGYDMVVGGVDSGFTRRISVAEMMTEGEIKVTSTVSWTQGAGGSVTFSESLFNWIELPQ